MLQEGELKRVGSAESVRVDVRVIAATHRDLPKLVKSGKFREDLFYRLNVINIPLPPLRDRVDDVPLLAHHFLRRYAERLSKKVRSVTPEAIELLCGYRWPGNVRELENAIERAVVLCRGDAILPGDLPPAVTGRTAPLVREAPASGDEAAWLVALLRGREGAGAAAVREGLRRRAHEGLRQQHLRRGAEGRDGSLELQARAAEVPDRRRARLGDEGDDRATG